MNKTKERHTKMYCVDEKKEAELIIQAHCKDNKVDFLAQLELLNFLFVMPVEEVTDLYRKYKDVMHPDFHSAFKSRYSDHLQKTALHTAD